MKILSSRQTFIERTDICISWAPDRAKKDLIDSQGLGHDEDHEGEAEAEDHKTGYKELSQEEAVKWEARLEQKEEIRIKSSKYLF